MAPFNGTVYRDKTTKLDQNPGPGTYAAEQIKLVKKSSDNQSNSFATKINRLCPTAPGGSVFKEPTYIQNPGPGSQIKTLKFMGNPKPTDTARKNY